MNQSPSTPCLPIHAQLEQRARQFDQLLAQHALDEHGITRAALWFDPVRPLAAGDIDEAQPLVPTATTEELYAYEDAGMASGAYLASQAIRYRLTGDPDALERANTLFQGIRHIYDLGASKCPGFFPKPYGGRHSEQFSRDQYLFAMSGLAQYHRIASPSTQRVIGEMLQHMADHWIRIGYRTNYFALPTACHLTDYMGPLFLGIIGIAAGVTGSARLQREYDRLFHTLKLGPRMPETLAAHFRAGRTYDGAMYFRQSENAMMMKAMAVDYLWERDPDHRALWQRSLTAYWQDDLLVPLDPETGLNYFILRYDPATDRCLPTEPGLIEQLENPLDLAFLNWGGKRQHAGSSQVAFASAIIAHRLQLPEAGEIVTLILNKLTLDRFRAITVPDACHIPPGHEFERNLLNSGYLAYWLWTYWLARERSLSPCPSHQ